MTERELGILSLTLQQVALTCSQAWSWKEPSENPKVISGYQINSLLNSWISSPSSWSGCPTLSGAPLVPGGFTMSVSWFWSLHHPARQHRWTEQRIPGYLQQRRFTSVETGFLHFTAALWDIQMQAPCRKGQSASPQQGQEPILSFLCHLDSESILTLQWNSHPYWLWGLEPVLLPSAPYAACLE